jgi:hypothetical protein
MQRITDTTYAVGILAFGRAVLHVVFVFRCALVERTTKHSYTGKYHAAVRPELVEGQTKRRVRAAPRDSCHWKLRDRLLHRCRCYSVEKYG